MRLLRIYYGEDVKGRRCREVLGKEIMEDHYPDCDVEIYSGGQPIYYYVVSIE